MGEAGMFLGHLFQTGMNISVSCSYSELIQVWKWDAMCYQSQWYWTSPSFLFCNLQSQWDLVNHRSRTSIRKGCTTWLSSRAPASPLSHSCFLQDWPYWGFAAQWDGGDKWAGDWRADLFKKIQTKKDGLSDPCWGSNAWPLQWPNAVVNPSAANGKSASRGRCSLPVCPNRWRYTGMGKAWRKLVRKNKYHRSLVLSGGKEPAGLLLLKE